MYFKHNSCFVVAFTTVKLFSKLCLLAIKNVIQLVNKSITSQFPGPGPQKRRAALAGAHNSDLRAHLFERRRRQRGSLLSDCEKQEHAHGHQLLPLLARGVRPDDPRLG